MVAGRDGCLQDRVTLDAISQKGAFGALQGALLVKRATEDAGQLRDVVTVLKAQLTAPD